MDADLRASLWNLVHVHFLTADEFFLKKDKRLYTIASRLQFSFFKKPIDDLPSVSSEYISSVKAWVFSADWHEVYDFVEFVLTMLQDEDWEPGFKDYDDAQLFARDVNNILEREKSGYRVINEQIASIVSEVEIVSIEDALKMGDRFSGAREHLKAALQLYSIRRDPDYRNSVKEAISAIESAAVIISGDPKATLGKALAIIEKRHDIHGSMKEGFSKLYGYTSDAGGIRHAMLEERTVEEHEARFMLIACSAFLNYLVAASSSEP